jgi:hypothetical protein
MIHTPQGALEMAIALKSTKKRLNPSVLAQMDRVA